MRAPLPMLAPDAQLAVVALLCEVSLLQDGHGGGGWGRRGGGDLVGVSTDTRRLSRSQEGGRGTAPRHAPRADHPRTVGWTMGNLCGDSANDGGKPPVVVSVFSVRHS